MSQTGYIENMMGIFLDFLLLLCYYFNNYRIAFISAVNCERSSNPCSEDGREKQLSAVSYTKLCSPPNW